MTIGPYEFAVYFKNGGKDIIVEPPKGQNLKPPAPISTDPLNDINKLDILKVAHKPDKSPCCIIWDGVKYCWC